MTGISAYGTSIPLRRIKVEEIAKQWGDNPENIKNGLRVKEKTVRNHDEDSATLAVEASREAIKTNQINAKQIEAVYVGSESPPYAVKPTAGIVAEAVGATPNLTGADLEFACKAGTAGIQAAIGMIKSNEIDKALVIGTDTSQSSPNNALEYSAGCGAGALVLDKQGEIAEIKKTTSYTTDTPDFWRKAHKEFPDHGGRFTGKPAYFKHVINSTKNLLEQTGKDKEEFDYFIFHQPNGKFPLKAAKKLEIPKEKVEPGLVTPKIGNTYSAATFLGLSNVLDRAKPGQEILLTSYGSGAGSDSFWIKMKQQPENKLEKKKPEKTLEDKINRKKYVDYGTYASYMNKLKEVY